MREAAANNVSFPIVAGDGELDTKKRNKFVVRSINERGDVGVIQRDGERVQLLLKWVVLEDVVGSTIFGECIPEFCVGDGPREEFFGVNCGVFL